MRGERSVAWCPYCFVSKCSLLKWGEYRVDYGEVGDWSGPGAVSCAPSTGSAECWSAGSAIGPAAAALQASQKQWLAFEPLYANLF